MIVLVGLDRRANSVERHATAVGLQLKPQRKGFGSLMIQRGLAHDLGGDVQRRFEPSGVICTMDMPLSAAQGEA